MGDRVRQRDRPMRLGEGIGAGPFEIGAGQAGDCPAPTHVPTFRPRAPSPIPVDPTWPSSRATASRARDGVLLFTYRLYPPRPWSGAGAVRVTGRGCPKREVRGQEVDLLILLGDNVGFVLTKWVRS
ncbi:hypothetical protein Ssi03_35060 [Sphaerisporangium siamense]|nr:hypothetical protein Ssi03_35060 [Sphaerisporangium siamense]